MMQDAAEFASRYGVPLLGAESEFPEYFASHALADVSEFGQDYLLSSRRSGQKRLTSLIDEYLGADDFVFFALGKGYLSRHDSFGLLYDPNVVAKMPEANLVHNDLLYVLNDTDLLQRFCERHSAEIDAILWAEFSDEAKRCLWRAIRDRASLLIGDDPASAAYVFERVLSLLPSNLELELRQIIKDNIVAPNTITVGLDEQIDKLYDLNLGLLDLFFDETNEERMIELRVSERYPIERGLLAVYWAVRTASGMKNDRI